MSTPHPTQRAARIARAANEHAAFQRTLTSLQASCNRFEFHIIGTRLELLRLRRETEHPDASTRVEIQLLEIAVVVLTDVMGSIVAAMERSSRRCKDMLLAEMDAVERDKREDEDRAAAKRKRAEMQEKEKEKGDGEARGKKQKQ